MSQKGVFAQQGAKHSSIRGHLALRLPLIAACIEARLLGPVSWVSVRQEFEIEIVTLFSAQMARFRFFWKRNGLFFSV